MSDIHQTVPGLTPPDESNMDTRRSRWPVWLVLAVVLGAAIVGIPVGVAAHEASGYFLFSPGTAPVITLSDTCKPAGGELALPDGRALRAPRPPPGKEPPGRR